jgi:hypothetical protein
METLEVGDLVHINASYIDSAIVNTHSTLWIILDTYFLRSAQITVAKVLTGRGIAHYSYALLEKVV